MFYHLEELDESLKYALRAGELFSVEDNSQYVQTLVSKCIDDYIKLRVDALDAKQQGDSQVNISDLSSSVVDNADTSIDSSLVAVVESVFTQCLTDGQYKQALGIAVESRRLDKLVQVIKASGSPGEMLEYTVELARNVVVNRTYRHHLLRMFPHSLLSLSLVSRSVCMCISSLFNIFYMCIYSDLTPSLSLYIYIYIFSRYCCVLLQRSQHFQPF